MVLTNKYYQRGSDDNIRPLLHSLRLVLRGCLTGVPLDGTPGSLLTVNYKQAKGLSRHPYDFLKR